MTELRITNQRLKILEHLKSVKTHPSAEMVFNEVSRNLPAITLATVYRNLNLLADQGEILKLEVNNEFRYDGDNSFHQHCVCKDCGNIMDLFQEEISKYALNKFHSNKFDANSVNVIFNGTCVSCKS
jgi:Fe2+ or Zn2+ uptake regulation protein